jgi:hypothetical protein
LGIGDWAQSPIPNPQSPIPNPQTPFLNKINQNNIIIKKFKFIFNKTIKLMKVHFNIIP